jgi:HD-like signal output (HDOD) protein
VKTYQPASDTHPIAELLERSKLPPFPPVAARLLQLMSEDDVDFSAVTKLLMTDASFSAEILRAANSPLFGTRNEVKSIGHALTTLGFDRVGMLAVTTALWRAIPGSFNRQVARSWWRHNLATAFFSDHLGRVSHTGSGFAYMAGILHSAGQLAFLSAFPTEYHAVLQESCASGISVSECERNKFGLDHCELGAALLASWRLPEELVAAARYHHGPTDAPYPTALWTNTACLAATFLGHAVFGRIRTDSSTLPEAVRAIIEDDPLCVAVEEKVNALESSLA